MNTKLCTYFVFPAAFVMNLIYSDATAQRLRPTIELGMNLTSLNYLDANEVSNTNARLLLNCAGFLETGFHNKFSLMFGLRYVRIGDSGNYYDYSPGIEGPFSASGKFETTQHYVSVPIRMKFKFLKKSRGYIMFGPEFGRLLHANLRRDFEIIYSPGNGTFAYRLKENVAVTQFLDQYNAAINLGFGYEFSVIDRLFYLLTQYSHGIRRIESDTQSRLIGFVRKTREFNISLGLAF